MSPRSKGNVDFLLCRHRLQDILALTARDGPALSASKGVCNMKTHFLCVAVCSVPVLGSGKALCTLSHQTVLSNSANDVIHHSLLHYRRERRTERLGTNKNCSRDETMKKSQKNGSHVGAVKLESTLFVQYTTLSSTTRQPTCALLVSTLMQQSFRPQPLKNRQKTRPPRLRQTTRLTHSLVAENCRFHCPSSQVIELKVLSMPTGSPNVPFPNSSKRRPEVLLPK
mmetsp:Transcript_8173/g.20578  ORF Transcript_8173/g.20578 Transcript_8173/m.20578 type:complete len:226 (-) Transcript_8173:2476-3153(-)